jgi:hypothetical protein
MSTTISTRVWKKSKHSGNALVLLLKLADNANDDGYCWPSIEYISEHMNVSTRTVIRLTMKLEECGDLFVMHSRRTGNQYIVRTGMTDAEFAASLKKHFGFDDQKISDILLCDTSVSSDVTLSVSSDVTSVSQEPSVTVNEPPHGAIAPKRAVGEALLDEVFGPRRDNGPAPPTRHWSEAMKDAWAMWGADSDEVSKRLRALGDRAHVVQRLGHALDTRYGLRPLWGRRQDVKSWMTGLVQCIDLAEGDEKLVLQAARELIEGGLTVSDPWSLHKKTRALRAAIDREQTVDREYRV